ncbi:hypothetical protein ACJJIX_03690 [Microbulbifer sp. VAAC004]|uniref:hypothetical protein n=1 Tax=unclassified Microbulbifer TaxID=2619833 RepID=UPI0040396F0B
MKHPSGYTIEDVIELGKEKRSQFDYKKFNPDFMGLVFLNEDRGWPITSSYRPAHQVTPDILTTGEQMFFENDILIPGESARAYIRLLSPEHYPHCLYIGKELNINEGSRVVGRVKVLEVYNDLLLAAS